MNNRNDINDELKGLNSNLPSENENMPYAVPEGYFDGLSVSIMSRIKGKEVSASEEIASLSPILASISRTMPYAVPEDYFQLGPSELSFLIHEDPQSAILSLVDRVTPYQVPLGYFANLSNQILDKITRRQAKVIPMVRRKWMRLSVAAIFAGIIALSGYFYFSQRDSNRLNTNDPIAQQLKNVSTNELDEFIKTTGITITSNETAHNKSFGHTEVRKLLHDVSDNELDAFLNQVPTDDEDLSATN